ncbi:uncharacterized protein LOC135388127 [Ornithodoros turicata]|uniref:uncharacterized protein LOC135388127 n=1 Tax=Ornithodoros turicata TaxID=34597 RepID=UPI0031392221
MGSWNTVLLGVYLLLLAELHGAFADTSAVCKRVIAGCLLDDCRVEIPCVNGACDAQGFCACLPCWEGESCDEYTDVYPPSFPTRSEVVAISDPFVPRPVFTASASDLDLEKTCSGREPCECAQVYYDIIAGNPYELFSVDNVSGNVMIKYPEHLDERASFPVTFGAWSKAALENNTEPESTMKVIFYLDTSDEFHGPGFILDHNEIAAGRRSRRKREALLPQQSESLNYRTDFQLTIVGGDPSAMELGRVLEYELVISVPPTERMDLLVDIFTKDVIADNYVPPLAIYDIKTEIPPEMTFTNGEPAINKMLSESVTNVYDRIVMEFGTLSNPDTTRKIIIRFAVTAVRVKMNSKVHYVTVGAEYDYETFVWVGQTEVTVTNPRANEDEKQLEVDINGPGEVALDSAGIFSLDMYLKIRSDKVSVMLEGPPEMEDLLAIGNLGISKFGGNFKPVPNDVTHYKTVMTPSATKISYSGAKIDMGLITNTGSIYQKPRVENNKINFTFSVFALNRPDHVNETVSFTLKINVANKNMYTETFYVNLTAANFDEPVNNIEDVYPVSDMSKITLAMLVKSTLHLNVTSGGFTAVRVMLEADPENPIQLCSARFNLEESGFNIPWANISSTPAILKDNHYIVDLGRVYISDQRQPPTGKDNTLVVDTFLYMDSDVEISFKEDGNLFPIRMKIGRGGDDARVVPFEALSLEQKRFMYNPDVKIFDAAGWREIYIGGAVAYDVIITMPPAATHNNVTVDVVGQNIPTLPGVHICRARVSFVGRALPCLEAIRDSINTYGTTYGKVNPLRKDTDSSRVNLGLVSHIPKSLGNYTESKIIVNVVANLQDDVEFSNGAPYGIITSVAINSKTIHTEEKKFVASRGPSKDLLKNNPIFAYSIPLWTEPVVPGFVTQFEIAVKTPPRTMGLYIIEVTTANPDISICVLKIKTVGDSLPCLDAGTAADYTLHDDVNDGNRKASLALQALANVGTYPMSATKYVDPNTVVFSVIIKIKETATKNKALKYRISYGSKGSFEESLTVPIAPPSKENGEDTGLSKPPRTMVVATHEENITTITPGAMLLMTLFLEMQPFSAAPISFDLRLDDGVASMHDFELCQEGISHLGKNYPCTKPSQWDKEAPRQGSRSFGHYNLNLMCNSFIDRKNAEENMLRFTVPLLLKHGVGIIEGTDISFTSTALAGDIARKTKTVKLKVADVPDQTLGVESPTVNAGTFGNIDIRIRQRLWVPFNITLGRGTMAELRVLFRGAVDEKSAIVNLHDIRIKGVGRNIPCWKARPLNISFASSFGNVQMDKASTSLGFFSNPGYSHVRGLFATGDDDVVVEVLAEMTDHSQAEDATRHAVTLTVSSLGWKAKATQLLRVVRTGKERSFMDLAVVMDDSRVYEREERVQVTAYIKHSFDSSAEPSKLTFRVFLPYFITFEALADVISVSQYKPTVKNSTMGVDIVFPTLMFADELELNFTLAVDPENKRGYGTGRTEATIPYRAVCDQHSRSGQKQTSGLACSDMKHILFTVNSNECVFDLGMESGAIENCQIRASSAADYEHAPWNVRKGGTKVWSPALKSSLSRHHLDVNFQRVTRVSQVEVLYIPGSRRVSRYSLMYSNNGRDWIKHGGIRTLNYKNSIAMDRLEKTIQARMLRIIVEEASDEHMEQEMLIGMQVELYGCYIEDLKPEGIVCEDDTTWYSDSKSTTTRHFAVDTVNNIVYFCDFHGMSNKVSCFSSRDEGKTWKILDNFLNYLVGFDPESGQMLATDMSGESYMASNDGVRWSLVPPRIANASAVKPGFMHSIAVPAVTRSDILSKNLIIGDWRATFDGLVYKDAEAPAASWSGCCPM